MSPEKEKHLNELLLVSNALMTAKYRAGDKKHGGDLKDMSVLELNEQALEENTDQRFYLLEQRLKLLKND